MNSSSTGWASPPWAGSPAPALAPPLAGGLLIREVDELLLAGDVEPEVVGGQQRPGRRDVGRDGIVCGPHTQVPGPRVAADVEHRRHPRAQGGAKETLRVVS